ncbi:Por secretion system C-terminal sorting domain-containing protein [Dyadobacter soli]|uniref:Por secretion system C-terminal sorting domain-containing protein n=1 Tax=Dyadobacter soli TaxID=659014 RepID=A0A1G7GBM7_9BACT|nr:T9SS type A sorting domain-containing protein [Dyadobacter soli]SDE85507.1 Por secretion system C-terminal sorting domain-containing protein [Dyadobacter soli]
MKTLIASVLLTCSLALSTNGFAKSETGISNVVGDEIATRFWVVSTENGKINVNVLKGEKAVSLNVVDQTGRTLASKSIKKSDSATRTTFDLSQLPDGAYKVVLIDGKHKEIKTIELNTETAEAHRIVSLG